MSNQITIQQINEAKQKAELKIKAAILELESSIPGASLVIDIDFIPCQVVSGEHGGCPSIVNIQVSL